VGCVMDRRSLRRRMRRRGKCSNGWCVRAGRCASGWFEPKPRADSNHQRFFLPQSRARWPPLAARWGCRRFMDPIFSAGVFLAMHSGRLAAGAVAESLRRGDDGAPGSGRMKSGSGRRCGFTGTWSNSITPSRSWNYSRTASPVRDPGGGDRGAGGRIGRRVGCAVAAEAFFLAGQGPGAPAPGAADFICGDRGLGRAMNPPYAAWESRLSSSPTAGRSWPEARA